ncbi:MAG: nucleotidyltransferase domain-containing protein [Betaproteobacteria bacterium]
MPRHERVRQAGNSRLRIASAAARLMADGGIGDFGLAKKKALRQLGLPENTPLPDNAEVETELRAYQALYHGDEQLVHLRALRETALEVMELLEDFKPYLTGSVLDGTAGRFSDINILLFADSAKDVEIFLLNHGAAFEHLEASDERIDAVLQLQTEVADVKLVILAPNFERVTFRSHDGRVREKAKIAAVRQLLDASGAIEA